MNKQKQGRNQLLAFGLLYIIMFLISFQIGKYPVSPKELGQVLLSTLLGRPKSWTGPLENVIFRIRMPRILAGSLVGAGLSAAGAAYQGLFRNPMASPDILGASAGAGFGAALCLFLTLGYTAVMLGAFVFGLLAVAITYLVSRSARQDSTVSLVLAGIMVSSLFSSATSLIKLLADTENVLPAITYWLMGSLASVRLVEVAYAGVPIVLGLIILFVLRWPLNLLTMGEDEARSMGVNVPWVRGLLIVATTLITAASVAISGMIGWIGLVIPHFSRMLAGYDYRTLLPTSMLMGASFLLLVDNIARSLSTAEIPLGILTAFVGAPFFLFLLVRREDTQ